MRMTAYRPMPKPTASGAPLDPDGALALGSGSPG